MILDIKNNYDIEIAKYEKVLIDFYKDDCIPCKMISEYLEEMNNNDFLCIKINIKDALDFSKKYNITTVPSFILFKNGKAVKKILGFVPKNKIWSFYNE